MSDLRYSREHEWVRVEGDVATVGISDFAQEQLGDVVFVELPEIGTRVLQGDEMGVVESVKTAGEVYAPLSGEVVEVNTQLEGRPETVNEAPTLDGWLVRMRIADPEECGGLMDQAAYDAYVGTLA